MEFILAATSIVPDRSAGFTVTVIIAGLGIVLGTLALLILIFALFGKAVSSAQNGVRKKKAEASKQKAENSSAPPVVKRNEVPLPPPVLEAQGTPPEIIAAISAAVYAYEGEGAVITSITRKKASFAGRSVWAQAAVIENTKPF